MNNVRPCVICQNVFPKSVRMRCPCGGRHVICPLCEMTQGLIEATGPDTDTLHVCPDALATAAAVMHEEPKAAVDYEHSPLPPTGMGNVLPSSTTPPVCPIEGDLYYNSNDNVMRAYKNGQWIEITSATP